MPISRYPPRGTVRLPAKRRSQPPRLCRWYPSRYPAMKERAQTAFNPTETGPPGEPASDADSVTPEQMVAAFEEVLYGIYEKALPSVVYIRVPTLAGEGFRGMPGIPDSLLWSAGSGFVWDSEGHIVTNHHVVEEAIGSSRQVTVDSLTPPKPREQWWEAILTPTLR